MECKTDPKKKRMYQCRLWGLFLGNAILFAAGCAVMAMGLVPDPFRGLGAIGLAVLACCLFPSSLLLIHGLSLSGTQRVFLMDGTLLYCTWDADLGEGGAKHRFYKVWKISDYEVKPGSIEIKAFVLYAEKEMIRGSLPVQDGYLGDISEIFEKAERCQREFSIRRTLENEEGILEVLNSRRESAAAI